MLFIIARLVFFFDEHFFFFKKKKGSNETFKYSFLPNQSMVEQSAFRGTIEFFQDLGVYDVVLPFLLVFTIVFAILEKTKVFGTEEIEGKKYTRKNINAMVAFVTAFFVIASSRVVEIITEVSANVVLLLLASVLFLMLVGSFYKETPEGTFLEGPWKQTFVGIMFLGLTLIFMNAIKSGERSWLEVSLDWLKGFSSSKAVASVIFVIIIILFMVFIVMGGEKKPSAKKPE